MRFKIRHLLYVIAVFAASLASGCPGSLIRRPDGVWKVVSIDEEEGNGGDWRRMHPAMGTQFGGTRKDYIATIQNGHRTQTINLGDTVFVSEHRLTLPEVGSYVVLKPSSRDPHARLPVTSVDAPSGVEIVLAVCLSLLCSIALVAFCLFIQWSVRRQAYLYRESQLIDRSCRKQADT